jgi:hypothetical protein
MAGAAFRAQTIKAALRLTEQILRSPKKQKDMKRAQTKLAHPLAASEIADWIAKWLAK